MKSILVPTDFSENANTAIEFALELAKPFDAKVLVANIYTPNTIHFGIVNPAIREETESARKVAEAKLISICNIAKDQYGPTACSYEFVVGEMVESIQELVTKYSVNLIVMGTRGATGLSKIFFGSNTVRVLEKVMCPVLAIPQDSAFKTPQRIVYASDFNISELKHINELVTIAKAFGAELIMTHVTTNSETLLSEEMLQRNFSKRVGEITNYSPITYLVKYDEDIGRALESFAIQVDADWIAMLTHKRSLFEKLYNPSLTKAMAYHTKIPLLALKD